MNGRRNKKEDERKEREREREKKRSEVMDEYLMLEGNRGKEKGSWK